MPVLILALLISRLLFILLMPEVYSTDLHSWLKVMDVLEHGGNPYRETGVLNWPPFWMQILFAIHQTAKHLGISATHLVQATLTATEALVLCTAWFFAKRHFNTRRLFSVLLLGLAINPVCVFLSCQHCNYDVFVGLFILIAACMLYKWTQKGTSDTWLAACFAIGMGILCKTVPVILAPILLIGIRKLAWPTRFFGLILLAAPFTIGMSVLFTLEPRGVMDHVVGYRSMAGWYGISGLLLKWGSESAMLAYQRVSPFLFIAVIISTAIWSYRILYVSGRQLLIMLLLLVMFIPTFGPGYSPPYILWFLPLAVLVYLHTSRRLKTLMVVSLCVLILTYTTEYALFNSHGAFLLQWYPTDSMHQLSEEWSSRGGQVLIRIPMLVCYLVLFFLLLKELRTKASEPHLSTSELQQTS